MPASETTISIDFWNTLVRAESGGIQRRNARLKALHKIAARYTEKPSARILEEAKLRASKEFDVVWFGQQRTPTTKELVDNILGYLNIEAVSDEREYLVEAFEESLWEAPPELTPHVLETLPLLAERYPLALISDTMYSPGKVIRRYLERHGLVDCFRCFIFSDETGYSKPDPRAYRKVLETTGGVVEASWHIGDMMRTDITGAKQVGMKTILFTGASGEKHANSGSIKPDHVCDSWLEIRKLLVDIHY